MNEGIQIDSDTRIRLDQGRNLASSLLISILDWVGKDAVLVVTVLIGLSGTLGLSLLLSGLLSFLSHVRLSVLDVLESLSESILDGHDLSSSLKKEVVNLGLNFRVGLVVILLKLDLRNSLLDLSDQVSESLLSGLSLIISSDLLEFLRFVGLLLSLLDGNLFFLDDRLS